MVVIGGGVFGCATAFQLARRGIKTTLIEPDDFGQHASGKNPGNLNPVLNTPSTLIPLALQSFKLHQALAVELAGLGCADYDLQPVRRVLLAFEESERAVLVAASESFAGRADFVAAWMDAEAVQQLDARLSKEVISGLLIEGNMSLNSRAFNISLAEGAARLGADIVRDRATGLDTLNNRITGMRTANGVTACDAVVFATGPWVAQTEEWLGFKQPVEPIKGEMLRVRMPGPGLQYDFTRGMISLYRRGQDECWIGVTKEVAGFDEAPTEAAQRHLLNAAARIMPQVGRASVVEHAASLRPMSASGLPMVGRVPGWENAFVANGGGIKGILLCSGIGQAVSEMIVDGDTDLPVDHFRP